LYTVFFNFFINNWRIINGYLFKEKKENESKNTYAYCPGESFNTNFNDSQKLYQETKNPDVFISRFDLFLNMNKACPEGLFI